jgi:hypothetical protein
MLPQRYFPFRRKRVVKRIPHQPPVDLKHVRKSPDGSHSLPIFVSYLCIQIDLAFCAHSDSPVWSVNSGAPSIAVLSRGVILRAICDRRLALSFLLCNPLHCRPSSETPSERGPQTAKSTESSGKNSGTEERLVRSSRMGLDKKHRAQRGPDDAGFRLS